MITLIVIALLTVIVTAFLTSSGTDRLASRAYLSRVQADAAARGGADEAMATLKWAFEKFPDSVTVWDRRQVAVTGDPAIIGGYSEGTSLYLRASPSVSGSDSPSEVVAQNLPNVADRQVYVLPLVSGVGMGSDPSADSHPLRMPTPVPYDKRLLAVSPIAVPSANPTKPDGVSLNRPTFRGDKFGWIGTRLPAPAFGQTPAGDPTATQPAYGRWVSRKDANGKVVARYAYWMEDESFRAPINTAGADDQNRKDNPFDLPLAPSNLTLFGTTVATRINGVTNAFQPGDIITKRQGYPGGLLPDSTAWTSVGAFTNETAGRLRYLFTTTSGSLNLSRHGTVRLNLNTLGPVGASSVGTTSPKATDKIQTQVYKLMRVIDFHLPDFSERFYRTDRQLASDTANKKYVADAGEVGGGSSAYRYRDIYLARIAANIRDAIDEDSVPTLVKVNPDSSRRPREVTIPEARAPRTHPAIPGDDPTGEPQTGPNPIHAYGKEGGLFFDEAEVKYVGSLVGRNWRLTTHFKLEFWNLSDRDISTDELGPNPFVKILNAPEWSDNLGAIMIPESSSRDIHISLLLNNQRRIFKAGKLTVITTDSSFVGSSDCDVIVAKPNEEIGIGKTEYSGTASVGATEVRMTLRNGTRDYMQVMVLGSDNGFIEGSIGGIVISGSGPINGASVTREYGGSIRGNNSTPPLPGTLGDPRTNNDQMRFSIGSSDEATNYVAAATVNRTMGRTNSNYIQPENSANPWPDYYLLPSSNLSGANALAVVPNREFTSVGELGHVFDPARVPSAPDSSSILIARGGGRTLKIGQPDDRIDANPAPKRPTGVTNWTPSGEGWAAWRLTDIFCAEPTLAPNGSSTIQLRGRINVNGVLRDNGAAIRTLLHGLSPQPTSTGLTPPSSTAHGALQLAGAGTIRDDFSTGDPAQNPQGVVATGIAAVIERLRARLERPPPNDADTVLGSQRAWGPLWERGELSELSLFDRVDPNSPNTSLFGVDMSRVFDRGREEVFRRIVELTTTRGNVFTVYAVGQSVNELSNGNLQILGTSWTKVTFRLNPVFEDGGAKYDPSTLDFDPTNDASFNRRFAQPTRYEIQVLEVAPAD